MENTIDLGILNLGEKCAALAGKKINLNIQLKITYNPNEELNANNIKVEVVDKKPVVDKNSIDVLDIQNLTIDEIKSSTNDKGKIPAIKSLEESLDYDLVKENLEKDKKRTIEEDDYE